MITAVQGHCATVKHLELSSTAEAVISGLVVQKGLSPSLVANDVSRVGLLNCTGRGSINSSYNNRSASGQLSR